MTTSEYTMADYEEARDKAVLYVAKFPLSDGPESPQRILFHTMMNMLDQHGVEESARIAVIQDFANAVVAALRVRPGVTA